MIMDIKDAHKVIENLQTRPYICSKNTIELDNGYVIAKKEYFKECREAREKQIPKKPIMHKDTNRADCPICGATVRGIKEPFGDWCSKCGQKLDWSDTD